MSRALERFYEVSSNCDPARVADISVHNHWVSLLQNIPGIVYTCLKVAGGRRDKVLDKIELDEVHGFVPIDSLPDDNTLPLRIIEIGKDKFELYEKVVNGRTYLLVPGATGLICCELRSDIINIIVLLSKLFDLNLYDSIFDIDAILAKDALDQICKKLEITLLEFSLEREFNTYVRFRKSLEFFDLHVMFMHTSVSINQSQTLEKKLIDKKGVEYQQYPVQTAALTSLIDTCSLQDAFMLANKDVSSVLQLLSYVPFRQGDCQLAIIKDLIREFGMNPFLNSYTKSVIFRLPVLPGYHYQKMLFDYVVTLLESSGLSNSMKEMMQVLVQNITMLELHADDFVLSQDLLLYRSLFNTILNPGDLQVQVLLHNIRLSLYQDESTSLLALRILKLIQHLGFVKLNHQDIILQVVQPGLQHNHKDIGATTLSIVKDLMRKKLLSREVFLYHYFNLINQLLQKDDVSKVKALELLDLGYKEQILHDSNFKNMVDGASNSEDFEQFDTYMVEVQDYIKVLLAMLSIHLFAQYQVSPQDQSAEVRKLPKMIADAPITAQGKGRVALLN